jgi:hypothetical protein
MADHFCADRITRIRKYTGEGSGVYYAGNEEIARRASQNPESQSQSRALLPCAVSVAVVRPINKSLAGY